MHEAICSIKDTLGPDAVILSTKRVRSWDNGFGLLGGSMLEVMAAIGDDAAVPESAPYMGEDERSALAATSAPVPAEESRFQKTLQGAIEKRGPAAPCFPPGLFCSSRTFPHGKVFPGTGRSAIGDDLPIIPTGL